MSGTLLRRILVPLGIVAVVLANAISAVALRDPGSTEDDESEQLYDCGTLALHVMLRLVGSNVELRRVEAVLPPPGETGYSMRELRDAAATLRFCLVGRLLSKDEPLPDCPALAFVKRGPHGHFLVIRPLGVTGNLVQVIDSSFDDPFILDRDELYASPEWTGIVLVPESPNWTARIAWSLACVGLFAIVLLRMLSRQRRLA